MHLYWIECWFGQYKHVSDYIQWITNENEGIFILICIRALLNNILVIFLWGTRYNGMGYNGTGDIRTK